MQTEKKSAKATKPVYRVPLMSEINELPYNGRSAISLFSGCGGSSLGYRLAGFRVLYANEFIPEAAVVYRANFPNAFVDERDIRSITGREILDRISLDVGELDVLDGSPPCASFSVSGKREATWGKVRKYSSTHQRVDDLFYEYIRLVSEVRPKVFVAENVAGLVKGTAKGYFIDIFRKLRELGYVVRAKVLDAQWLGVPQRRNRIFYVGVREEFGVEPSFPKPLPYHFTVREVLPHLKMIRTHIGDRKDFRDTNRVAPTVMQSDWHAGKTALKSGGGWVEAPVVDEDTDISNYAIGKEWERLRQGKSSDKYFNLVRASLDEPSPTITQTGKILGAASVTHPTERRKFNLAELRRICSFPDDFELPGTYEQGWERLGRAVPPLMMEKLAIALRDNVFDKVE
jgi:DNA (cytosine-5)-methyltransferase 1